MAVEFLTSIESRFHVQIGPLEILGGLTLAQAAGRIADSVHSGAAAGAGSNDSSRLEQGE